MWFAVGATFFWGLAGWLTFYASRTGSATGAWIVATLVEASVAIPFLVTTKPNWNWWAVGVGVTGATAYGLYFVAMRQASVGAGVVAITAMYPVVSALLFATVTRQTLSLRQWLGVVLAVAAAWLVYKE